MYRHVTATVPIDGQPWPAIERFVHDPDLWLPGAAQEVGSEKWRFSVAAGPLHRPVTATIAEVWSIPDAWVRGLQWHPTAGTGMREHETRMLPSFSGRLTLRQQAAGLVLQVEGHYVPPFGRAGAALDVMGLHRAADATARHLADAIAERLMARTPAAGAR